jgi:hypothetical protein
VTAPAIIFAQRVASGAPPWANSTKVSPVLVTTVVKSGESFASVGDHRRQIRRKVSPLLMTAVAKPGEKFRQC